MAVWLSSSVKIIKRALKMQLENLLLSELWFMQFSHLISMRSLFILVFDHLFKTIEFPVRWNRWMHLEYILHQLP